MAAGGETLRRRRRDGEVGGREAEGALGEPKVEPEPPPPSLRPGTFWLTRLALLRATAFIYCEWGKEGKRHAGWGGAEHHHSGHKCKATHPPPPQWLLGTLGPEQRC